MAAILERRASDGTVSYFARIRRKGAKAVCASFKRKTDLKLWILETEKSILDGRYFERVEERKHSLNDALKRFILDYPIHQNQKSQLELWGKEIGHLLLVDVTPAKIHEVISKWKREPNKNGSVRRSAVLNRYLSTLSIVFTAAVRDWGWMMRNPA